MKRGEAYKKILVYNLYIFILQSPPPKKKYLTTRGNELTKTIKAFFVPNC